MKTLPKGVRLLHVDAKHSLCTEDSHLEDLPLPPSGFTLLRTCANADGAIMAWYQGQLIGFFRYYEEAQPDDVSDIRAAGTWVDPGFRRRGLAQRMWARALKLTGAQKVSVRTISRGGEALVKSLRGLHSGVKFVKLR